MATMENMENKEKVIEIIPEKEGFGKKVGNGIKTFWKRNQWWIMGGVGIITGVAVAKQITKNNGDPGQEEPSTEEDQTDVCSDEIPADTSTEE